MSLLPADTYIVKNNTILNNENRNVLFKLYQPIIGSIAINLYFTLWSDLDTSQTISTENNHHNLMAKTKIKLADLLEAREKLEAIGLLKTYIKKGNVNNYIYELYSPLDPKDFIENPVLSVTLQNNIGKNEYQKTIAYFKVPKLDLTGYDELTTSFNETFDIKNIDFVSDNISNIRSVNQVDIIVNSKIDLNKIFALIPDEYLNKKSLSTNMKSLIYKLAFIYNFNENELSELIRNSINSNKTINKELLRSNCQKYYSFEHKGKTPSLIYKKQPEFLRKEVTNDSNLSKMIYTYETNSPYDFLTGRNKGTEPSKHNLSLIEKLLIDYELNPGVVNVLIDFVLKTKDNKLAKEFVLTIADQWRREGIKTVEEAINISKKENNKRKVTKKIIKKEEKPKWYGKAIEEDMASEEDIKKLEELLRK